METMNDKNLMDSVISGAEGAQGNELSVQGNDTPNPDVSTEFGENLPEGAQEYKPLGKFRVLDQEKEFDDFIMSSIKTPEQESRVREIYEMASGLDHVKADRQRLREENSRYQETLQEHQELKSDLTRASYFLKNGDISSFLNELGLSDEQVTDYLIKKENLQADPNAYANFQRQQRMLHQNWDRIQEQDSLQSELEYERGRVAEFMVTQRENDLENELSNPSIYNHAQQFDVRMGEQGAFRKAVIEYGQSKWYTNNIDIPPNEAVRHIAQLTGLNLGQGNNPNNGYNNGYGTQTLPNNQTQSQRKVPVLPNMGNGSSTPVRTLPKSIDDLRKLHSQLSQQ